ncbi:signal peptidase complex subunit SPC3 NDAI_0G01740 [Naumovozyma dairenensis CBS 421]|uniref:Signal peptidase subunit 3 n=1 Tax=Naumovozyma dairenensis (strain ATCC 10597 / BCRC 20456 / CBS 421 / NBRC 0211 / NRRL Y-12639) TaxID=1071378 RepID=G0WDT9_NAUDC|nr:hypothetical protein NDAI_0G01740 [Naumovozyma dairenensis CBS 421]CCD25950.2 hypothetical protein NDAI_0G01740 [Naumovozyma dairenensis CBS 421]
MFSLSQRFQVVTNQAVTVGIFIVAFIVGSSWFHLYQNDVFNSAKSTISNIKPSINIRTSRYYGSTNGKAKENLKVSFDLSTDLSPLFNWNTKQVFVYLTASYNGSSTVNEVTFWDKIIEDKNDAVLELNNEKSKYAVWDLENGFSGKELQFNLHWNIQPWVGGLLYGQTNGIYHVIIPEKEKKPENSSGEEQENDSSVAKKKLKRARKQQKAN